MSNGGRTPITHRQSIVDERQLQKRLEMQELIIMRGSIVQFTGSDPRHCAVFGCNKVLTLVESLAGNKCLDHQTVTRVDVMRVVRFK